LKRLRLLDTGRLTAAENMALDKIILEEVAAGASPPTLRFLQFNPAAALVGYHQDVNLEIRLDYCKTHGIDINRRLTGGGSIFFQESALGWELFGVQGTHPFNGAYELILRRICSAAALGISSLGINAEFRPRNDIEVNGRKISGTGGVNVSGGFMFQGTILVENEVENFLKALRVPVEKLKKREIESLLDRICFLSDLIEPTPSIAEIKEAFAKEFSKALDFELVPGELTANEAARGREERDWFAGTKWIMSRSRPASEGEPIRSIYQTKDGTIRVHVWVAPGGRRIRQVLFSGDFFTVPARLIHDLEAALVGERLEVEILRESVISFFSEYEGRVLGISPEQVAEAVVGAGRRVRLLEGSLSREESNELFLVNLLPEDLPRQRPRWLLLPYCSKNLDCPNRGIPGCDECGECQIADCYDLARSFDMEPVTVQSFEHLMEVLRTRCADTKGIYVGSCCEAFYSKHQNEMESISAQGVLVNLDSTTCYDLGKGTQAYKGLFDNKTSLNMGLIEKTLHRLYAATEHM
jgi:lipoate---protein ligase